MKKTLTNIGAGAGLAAVITLGTGVAAYAHECYNPNRSEQGNAGASNSQAWYTIDVAAELSAELPADLAECVYDAYLDSGAPATFTIMVKGAVGQDGTIASNNPHEEKTTDGKGIDEVFAAYGEEIVGSYTACGLEF